MVSIKSTCAVIAASLLAMASAQEESSTVASWALVKTHIPTPTTTLPANQMKDIGCFETGIPLQNYGKAEWQSSGNCQFICLMLDKNVLGLSDGENCWCGDKIPAEEWQVDNSTCNTPCSGTSDLKCGGPLKLWVMLTGNTRNEVEHYKLPKISSSSSSSSSSAQKTSDSSASHATQTPTASSNPNGSGGNNTAAIAAGVVVGVVGLAAIIGGVLYFLRRRRQKQAENDYRRNAANVDSFVSGGKLHTSNSSMNDSRLDPIFVDRRQSNGSIADNEDYSRRILKVTNA